jgi:hypothetical protein
MSPVSYCERTADKALQMSPVYAAKLADRDAAGHTAGAF